MHRVPGPSRSRVARSYQVKIIQAQDSKMARVRRCLLKAAAVVVAVVGAALVAANWKSTKPMRSRHVPFGTFSPNQHAPCNNLGAVVLPALPLGMRDEHLAACDLTQGLAFAHRCDLRRGYTFFTFDPARDEHVSHGMIATGGLYDGHVHMALDISLAALRKQGVTCGAGLATRPLFGLTLHTIVGIRWVASLCQ